MNIPHADPNRTDPSRGPNRGKGREAAARRGPAALEREASEIRANMDRTLDALERKLSPGRLLDHSLGYLRDHGGDLTRNVGDTVKHNPIPVLLTAAGLAWLITSSLRSRSPSGAAYADTYDETGRTSGETPGKTYYTSAAEKPGLKQKVGRKLHERTESVKRKWRSSRASGRMSGAMSASRDRASGAMSATRNRAHQAQERAHVMMDEQPLVIGALAVAAGAIVGALLPMTQYEDRTMGPVRDRTLDKAKEAGERQYQNLRSKLESREDVHVSGQAS